ncbi:hypothetical protein K438DRAFT_1111354 [Mycena galopus ATCC 62051]|nr:hypothetical protein K438DRAFT_1111354 [Mycena galopus ATCC 62051]
MRRDRAHRILCTGLGRRILRNWTICIRRFDAGLRTDHPRLAHSQRLAYPHRPGKVPSFKPYVIALRSGYNRHIVCETLTVKGIVGRGRRSVPARSWFTPLAPVVYSRTTQSLSSPAPPTPSRTRSAAHRLSPRMARKLSAVAPRAPLHHGMRRRHFVPPHFPLLSPAPSTLQCMPTSPRGRRTIGAPIDASTHASPPPAPTRSLVQ